MAMHNVYTLSVLSLSPSILSGTDSEGLGGPLSRSFSMGDNILFEVKSNSRSKSQKQSVNKKRKNSKHIPLPVIQKCNHVFHVV